MKIPDRHQRLRLRCKLGKVQRARDRLNEPIAEMAQLCLTETWLERDMTHCLELTQPAADLADLWPTIATVVGNVEPMGLRDAARPGCPVRSAACLRAALAIVRSAILDRRRRFAELEDRHNFARAAFTRAAGAARAAGVIQLEPGDITTTGDAEADGKLFIASVAELLFPLPKGEVS